jgi:hypothetical protein
LGSKAEQLLEKKKHEVEDIANQKKQMASEMLEEQAKKTGDAVWSTKSELETTAVKGAMDAKHTAIDALDEEFSKAETAVDSTIEQASAAVDTKMKEADKFMDEKREQVEQVVKETTQNVAETKDQTSASILGKAKGVLNCKYGLIKWEHFISDSCYFSDETNLTPLPTTFETTFVRCLHGPKSVGFRSRS